MDNRDDIERVIAKFPHAPIKECTAAEYLRAKQGE
jgi:hypothetical protein